MIQHIVKQKQGQKNLEELRRRRRRRRRKKKTALMNIQHVKQEQEQRILRKKEERRFKRNTNHSSIVKASIRPWNLITCEYSTSIDSSSPTGAGYYPIYYYHHVDTDERLGQDTSIKNYLYNSNRFFN
jgi:hypothetical protein